MLIDIDTGKVIERIPRRYAEAQNSRPEGDLATDFEPVYRRLRAILEPYGRRLHVTGDSPTTYAVDLAPEVERDPTTWFGGVRLGKRYVSYYLMPVYVDPSLAETISPALKRHMQGKSCFNFSRVDDGLFDELEALTKRGYERTGGDQTWGAARRVEHGMAHRRAGSTFELTRR